LGKRWDRNYWKKNKQWKFINVRKILMFNEDNILMFISLLLFYNDYISFNFYYLK
jgi:hypothetical protein